jgi:hypothetical protein
MVKHNKRVKKKIKIADYAKLCKLVEARTKSVPSPSEQKIIDLLVSECVEFEREVAFEGLYSTKGYYLFFDFFLPSYRLLIEFDGYHHYDKNNPNYLTTRHRDGKKNRFAQKYGYDLLRIPYWQDPISRICQKLDEIIPLPG